MDGSEVRVVGTAGAIGAVALPTGRARCHRAMLPLLVAGLAGTAQGRADGATAAPAEQQEHEYVAHD